MLTLESPPTTTTPRLRDARPPVRTTLQSLRRYVVLGSRLVLRRLWELVTRGRAAWLRMWAAPKLARATKNAYARLCLGSGNAPLAGWTNVDLDGTPDVRLDLCARLPIADGAVRAIYSEHLIEHLSCEQGLALLRECRRVLHPDGVLRVATPDLAALVGAYAGDWREQDWVRWPGHEWIDTPARMLNQAIRGWGHQHLYDEAELRTRLRAAGFRDVCRQALGASDHPDLRGLETRVDSKLILEARGRPEKRP